MINNRFNNPDHEVACSCGLTARIFWADDRPGGEGYLTYSAGWTFNPGPERPGWNCGKPGHYQAAYKTLPKPQRLETAATGSWDWGRPPGFAEKRPKRYGRTR